MNSAGKRLQWPREWPAAGCGAPALHRNIDAKGFKKTLGARITATVGRVCRQAPNPYSFQSFSQKHIKQNTLFNKNP
jgi:hypothetical protein